MYKIKREVWNSQFKNKRHYENISKYKDGYYSENDKCIYVKIKPVYKVLLTLLYPVIFIAETFMVGFIESKGSLRSMINMWSNKTISNSNPNVRTDRLKYIVKK